MPSFLNRAPVLRSFSSETLPSRLESFDGAPLARLSRLIEPERNFFVTPNLARESTLLSAVVRQQNFLLAHKDDQLRFSFKRGEVSLFQAKAEPQVLPATFIGVSEKIGSSTFFSSLSFHEASRFVNADHAKRSFRISAKAESLLLDSLELSRARSKISNQPTGKDVPEELGFQVAALASALSSGPSVPFGVQGRNAPHLKYWAVISTPKDYVLPKGVNTTTTKELVEIFRQSLISALPAVSQILEEPYTGMAALAEHLNIPYQRGTPENPMLLDPQGEKRAVSASRGRQGITVSFSTIPPQ